MKYCVLALSLASAFPAHAWVPQTGDIVFQISRSSQSKAIQLATHSAYSHTGMVVISNKKPYVFEAIGPVVYTPLQKLSEFDLGSPLVRARLRERYGQAIPMDETVISPQALFDAPQLGTVEKTGLCSRGN